ncbi:hypothetical protein BV25DRAFT_568042 [Artomyces pyxidatus]|uniref:Uncharacterized protein n=1 Tax=Artomyces pyxidatus TaxID=48021 RepID=A0ACB8TIV3_9AGAM|nr:hypothetical protein BV25DRAFT_568042 [Artomyces pyxidatus]
MYAPPPDDPTYTQPSSSSRFARPWFPAQTSSRGIGSNEDAEEQPQNLWETRYGMRVDALAAFAYLLGPLSALALLMFETHNDYVRFHAYQAGLLTTPLLLIRIFASLLQLPTFFRTLFTLILIIPPLYMAFRAYRDAAHNGLTRFHLPGIGQLAEQWLQEE